MERFFGLMIVPYISAPWCIGEYQFAYQKERGARDALALMTLTWIQGFNGKFKFSVYCSDVSGAFDRVNRERLIQKILAKGVRKDIVKVFASWLDRRKAVVIVGGAQAEPFDLQNMIYQGTVWGPWLWNIFYEDARQALYEHGFG